MNGKLVYSGLSEFIFIFYSLESDENVMTGLIQLYRVPA